jgi:hypothetical protein
LRALLSTWRGRLIAAFLLVQALLPLDYYCVRRDFHDERFAWRMFSPMRMTKCRLAVTVDKQPVDLGATFHEAWIEIAQRGRATVIEEIAHKLCREHPGAPVNVTVDCKYMDRPDARYGGFDLCTRSLL